MQRKNILLWAVVLLSGCVTSLEEIDFSQVNSEEVYGASNVYNTIQYDGVRAGQSGFRQINFSVINPIDLRP